MATIAMPAFSEATYFFKKNWRGVMLLALKTYLLILLFHGLASIPGHLMMEPETAFKLHTNPMSVWDLPPALLTVNMVTGVVGYFLSQWLVSPLYVSISRSVVLGEPFDRFLFRHLTKNRTLRVAKLLWSIILIVIPFYLAGFGFLLLLKPAAQGATVVNPALFLLLLLASLIYLVVFIYISMRVYYLIPPLACDRRFSNLSEMWALSKGKAWSIFKVFLLVGLIALCFILLLIIVFVLLSLLMGFVATLSTGKLAAGILVGALMVLAGIVGLVVLALVIPQLVTATIASVYKLSQYQANVA